MTDLSAARPNGACDTSAHAISNAPTLSSWRFAAIFLLAFVLISVFGYLNYRRQVAAFEASTYQRIEAIGNLQAGQVAYWLKQRRGDALTIFNSRVGVGLQAFLADPGNNVVQRPQHLTWLKSLLENNGYSRVVLVDAEGRVILSAPEAGQALEPETHAFIEEALRTRHVVFSDLYRADTHQEADAIRLAFVVPLLIDPDQNGAPIGTLLLQVDPYDYLYPLLRHWPVPSPSAEALLVRQDKEDVVFLSPLRHRPDAPLSLHLPLSSTDLPAAKALRGETGELVGLDYRGVPVLAALRAIPGSAWYVVAKIDQQEVRKPLRRDIIQTLTISLLLIITAGFLAWGYWRRYNESWVRRTNRFLETQIEARTAELRDSETRLRLALQASRVGLWDWDLRTQAVYFSPEWKRQLGYEDNELANHFETWESRLHPEDHDRVLAKTMAYIKQPGPDFENEFRLRHKDGRYRWILVRAALLTDEEHKPLRMMGSHTDITEQKQAELRQRALLTEIDKQRQILDTVLASIVEAIYMHDRAGRYSYVNPAGLRLFDLELSQIQGKTWRELGFPAEAMAHFDQDLQTVFKTSELIFREVDFTGPKGKRILEILLSPVLSDRGVVTAVISTVRDITERKQIEERLRLWQYVAESSKNGLVVVDAKNEDHPVITVNPAFERITGYPANEVLGRNLRFLFGQDHVQPGLATMRVALRQQRSCEVVLRNYRKDGTLFWNALHIAPLRNSAGQVTHFIGVQDDITQRKAYEAQLEFQANYDPLTQLSNRNLLQDRLQHAIVRAQRTNQTLGVLFLDLDHFKVVNDTLNRAMGDLLLQRVAERLKACVRESDTVARLGGDEFVILLEDLSQPERVTVIAEKVMDTTMIPYTLDNYDFFVSISIGISLFPRDGMDSESLLKNADIAMHRAKDQGRHRIEFYSPALNEQIQRRVNLENALRQALAQQQLVLYYQPQVNLNSNQVTGMEALIRWRHPTLGMISPLEFIPLAEESGLIIPIGAWVLRTACAQAKSWRDAGLPIVTMGVNLSPRQFLEAGLAETVGSALRETGLEPAYLELEITESMIMRDVESAIATMQLFKAMGVRLAIDDFGTGYSSLAYLKQFPLDRLKIDQSFVRDVAHDADAAAITRAVIALARNLGLLVIAEGVETETQLAFLRDKDCEAAQGYFFSRPLPADELLTWFQQWSSH